MDQLWKIFREYENQLEEYICCGESHIKTWNIKKSSKIKTLFDFSRQFYNLDNAMDNNLYIF